MSGSALSHELEGPAKDKRRKVVFAGQKKSGTRRRYRQSGLCLSNTILAIHQLLNLQPQPSLFRSPLIPWLDIDRQKTIRPRISGGFLALLCTRFSRSPLILTQHKAIIAKMATIIGRRSACLASQNCQCDFCTGGILKSWKRQNPYTGSRRILLRHQQWGPDGFHISWGDILPLDKPLDKPLDNPLKCLWMSSLKKSSTHLTLEMRQDPRILAWVRAHEAEENCSHGIIRDWFQIVRAPRKTHSLPDGITSRHINSKNGIESINWEKVNQDRLIEITKLQTVEAKCKVEAADAKAVADAKADADAKAVVDAKAAIVQAKIDK